MTSTTDDTSKAANFQSLSFFRIYVSTPSDNKRQISVFRNTRQQCRIQVAFIAVNGNNQQVHLTPAEIQSNLRLIRYTGGAEIEHGDYFYSHPDWYSSFTNQGYVWDQPIMAAAQALQDDVDKVVADNLDIDNLAASDADDKSSRIRSLTSTAPEHHWDKAFFKEMVAEGRREASAEAKAPLRIDDPNLVPNDRPLLSCLSGDESGGLQEGAQVVTFFVSTTSTSQLSIAASIRSSTHGTFRTNHTEVTDPAGHGNGRGEFNSEVIVNTLPTPAYPISAYGDFMPMGSGSDYVLQHHSVYGGGTGLRAYEHYISLTADGRWTRLRRLVMPSLTAMSVFNDVGDVGAEWSYSYAGNAGETQLHHASGFIGYFNSGNNGSRQYDSYGLINRVAPNGIHRPRAGQIVIGQIMSNDHWQIADWDNRGMAVRSEPIAILDEYGNDHRLTLYLPNGHYKFNFIAIAKT